MRYAVVVAVALLVPGAAAGQQYQEWRNPDAPQAADTRLQEFVDRLGRLVDEAEKARAADPRLLRDLRDLARGFERPWRTVLLSDDFRDGDFTTDPVWTVTAGRFWVERGWGLRSAITAAAPAAPEQPLRGKDAAAAIFGQILQQAIDPEGRASGGAPAAAADATAIQTAARLTNAFAIEIDLSSWKPEGRLEIGPYAGAAAGGDRAPGYVLAYSPGGRLELLRVSSRGASVIDASAEPVSLEDKKTHRVEWTRHADGRMRVAVDGREVLAVADRRFQGAFDGLRVVNRGGDYILGRIQVLGVQ